MDRQPVLTRRPERPTSAGGSDKLPRPVDDLPAARRHFLQRFGDWMDPDDGRQIGAGGLVARGLLCVVICMLTAVAVIGVLSGVILAMGRFDSAVGAPTVAVLALGCVLLAIILKR